MATLNVSLSLFLSDVVVTLVLLLLRVQLSSLLEYLGLVGIKEGPGKVHLLQFIWRRQVGVWAGFWLLVLVVFWRRKGRDVVGGVGRGMGGGDFVLDQVVDLVGVVLDGGGDVGGGRVHDAVVDGVLWVGERLVVGGGGGLVNRFRKLREVVCWFRRRLVG